MAKADSRWIWLWSLLLGIAAPVPGTSAADLLVSSTTTGRITQIDGATGLREGSFALPGANGLTLSAGLRLGAGGLLHVGSSQSVCRFNASTGAFVDKRETGLAGTGYFVAVAADSSLFSNAFPGNQLVRFDGATGAPSYFGGAPLVPTGLDIGPDRNLYVGDFAGNQVVRFNPTTGESLGAFCSIPIAGSAGAAGATRFGPDGRLYVALYNGGDVVRCDGTTGAFLGSFIAAGDAHPTNPSHLAWGPDGNLYVASSGSGQVVRYDGTTGAYLGVFASGLAGLWGIEFVPDLIPPFLDSGFYANQWLLHGGALRFYDLQIPTSYDGTADVPLVIDLHGFGRNKEFQRGQSGFATLAEAQGFVVAWPNGLNTTWNAGAPCVDETQANPDDVGFIRTLVATISARVRTASRRIYITGQSCGGAMTHRLACEASDLFAAAAPFSWAGPMLACTPSRPIPILMTHSLDDALIHYPGGPWGDNPGNKVLPSIPEAFDRWRARDGCVASGPEVSAQPGTQSLCERYTTCAGGAEVELCSVHTDPTDLQGHYTYSPHTLDGFNTQQWAWDFLSRFDWDRDDDGALDPVDNCPTAANADQADADGDSMGDVCDNCANTANPRAAADFLANNAWATLTGGQRDDDHDGYGNRCDADFTPTGALVGSADLTQFRASNGKSRAGDNCGTTGTRPCAIFDLDESGTLIGSGDLARFRQLNGKVAGAKCPMCPLACQAGASGSCN